MKRELSIQDRSLADRLARKLEASRLAGTVTPENPITGGRLAEWFTRELGRSVTDATIRSWVHYLRREKGELIASSSREPFGYFYARKRSELDGTFAHLRSRRLEIEAEERKMLERLRTLEGQGTIQGELGEASGLSSAEFVPSERRDERPASTSSGEVR